MTAACKTGNVFIRRASNVWWKIDPRKSPEHAARRAALKAEFQRLHPHQHKGQNNNLRRIGDAWVKHYFAHPYWDEPSERWARAAAMTDAPPLNPVYFDFQLDGNDNLYIIVVETGTRYPVPEDSPPLMAALIRHLHTTTKK